MIPPRRVVRARHFGFGAALGAGSYFGAWYGGLAGTPTWVTPPNGSVDPDGTIAARNRALSVITMVLVGLVGSVIGGWLALHKPMASSGNWTPPCQCAISRRLRSALVLACVTPAIDNPYLRCRGRIILFLMYKEISCEEISGRCSVHPLHLWRPCWYSWTVCRQQKNGPDRPNVPPSTLDPHCGAPCCGKNDVVSVSMLSLAARRASQHCGAATDWETRH